MEPTDVIRTEDRVSLFVDAANIEHATRDLGFDLDWRKTRDHFVAGGHFADAYFYTAERQEDDRQEEFFHELATKGYTIRTKPLKVFHDDEGRSHAKGNLDIEITLDMIATSDNYDVAVLFSGDSDFQRVVEVLQSRGKRVYVVAGRESLSEELLHTANKPVFHLDDVKDELAWKH